MLLFARNPPLIFPLPEKVIQVIFFQITGEDETLINHHKSLSRILNEGENVNTLSSYKQAALKLFGMKDDLPVNAEVLN